MKIRYKMFLVIGSLFFVIFIGSFFIENRLAAQGVGEIHKDLLAFFEKNESEKRESIRNVVISKLSRLISEVNAALEVVSKFSVIKENFAPTKENIKLGTWSASANIVQDRENIDFVQNVFEDKVLSLITPDRRGIKEMYQEKINEDMCWVYSSYSMVKKQKPLLGIALNLNISKQNTTKLAESIPGIIPRVFVLYSVESLKNLSASSLSSMKDYASKVGFTVSMPFLGGYRLDIEPFISRLLRAHQYVRALPEEKGSIKPSWVAEEERGPSSICGGISCFFDELVSYVNQLYMIWDVCCLYQTGIMGESFSAPQAPLAIAFFPGASPSGHGLHIEDVLSNEMKFDALKYLQRVGMDSESLGKSIALIEDIKHDKLYLGNAARISARDGDKDKYGYFTLGIDLNHVLKQVAVAFKQNAWIVSKGKVITAVSPEGIRQEVPSIPLKDIDKILTAALGIFSLGKDSQYFVHIQPYEDIDVHFVLFTPAAQEFASMEALNAEFQSIISNIGAKRRYVIFFGLIILLASLLDLSKKITEPIARVAVAARSVKEGKLKEIDLPKLSLGKNNEIQQLNDSFSDMIQGLQEKEKVKGILDKVVSHDIASEILKGDIHLGGEEREVTIFFADIRNFTKITQNMPPHEVIGLVNACMTKLSHIIDGHHGVIDKYIGDEVMVLFGAPLQREDSALMAIECAIDIMNVLKQWNIERKLAGLIEIHMGIGIHTGKVFAGNMGAENRLNYTVIGSNVNLASRLCATAKPDEILISEETLSAPFVKENISVEDKGMIPLKGFDESKKVFCVIK